MWRPQLLIERTSVGLDVHARSIVGCAIDEQTGEIVHRRFGYDPAEAIAWVKDLPGPQNVVYEAGPTGFELEYCLRVLQQRLPPRTEPCRA